MVYRACTDLDFIARWRVPDGMTGKVDSVDIVDSVAIVDGVDGATYRMSLNYRTAAPILTRRPSSNASRTRIVERIRFDAADRAGEMTMTTSLRAVEGGTEVLDLL